MLCAGNAGSFSGYGVLEPEKSTERYAMVSSDVFACTDAACGDRRVVRPGVFHFHLGGFSGTRHTAEPCVGKNG